MLKVTLLAVVLAVACPVAVTGEAIPLVTGSVRDRAGVPVEGALVRALDARNGPVGSGRTDALGTFAVRTSGPAVQVEVSCRYCATSRYGVASAAEPSPVVAIVTRYPALVRTAPDQHDFAALPYPRPADAISLAPFVVPLPTSNGGDVDISDRGLERGRGLILDNGTPTYDLVHGGTALADFPDRSVQSVEMQAASAAFLYGSYAGGGTFVLQDQGPARAAASLDSGFDASLGGYATLGGFTPEAAISRDASIGLQRRRAGLDYQGDFAGGVLRVGAVAADQQPFGDSLEPERFVDIFNVAYATASRRYRTFIDASASQNALDDSPTFGGDVDRSSAVGGSFRVEHPGPVLTAFGVVGERYTGGYVFGGQTISARYSDDLVYAQASGGDSIASFDAGASVSHVGVDEYRGGSDQSASTTVVLPSLVLRASLGGPFGLVASGSRSLRIPTLVELAAAGPLDSQPLELGNLFDTGVTFDDARRFRAEATLFRESLSGFTDRQLTGVGFSFTWQLAPLISLRAWTLHDAAPELTPTPAYLPYVASTLSRGVVWATYDNNGAFRTDLIVHRDLVDGPAQTNIDGDVVVRLFPGLEATVGSSRLGGQRTSYVGLRLPLGPR